MQRNQKDTVRETQIEESVLIPDEYLCPITLSLMEDPVVADDGYSYERTSITEWFKKGHRNSPKTGIKLRNTYLMSNITLKILIEDFKAAMPEILREQQVKSDLEEAIRLREEAISDLLQKIQTQNKDANKSHKEVASSSVNDVNEQIQLTPGEQHIQELEQRLAKLELESRTPATSARQETIVEPPTIPARRYLQLFTRESVELLALGAIGLGAAAIVQHQRTTNARLKEQLDIQRATLEQLGNNFNNAQTQLFAWGKTVDSSLVSMNNYLHNIKLSQQRELATNVAFGKQEEAEILLQKQPELALMVGDITDCAGRQFKQITAFQYAVWALDWHMWKMIIKYLPKEEVRKQIEGLNNGEWVAEHGTQVSWQNLIDALQIYISNYNQNTASQNRIRWCKQVGKAQLMLPAHVIAEYSREDRSFGCSDICGGKRHSWIAR